MTPHNSAQFGDVAKKVIMSGDPLRSRFIAENYLEDVKLYNEIRGMYGFTGTYKGRPVSVQGHGMGIPSMGIYSYELFTFHDVDTIIRVGTCGSPDPSVELGSVVLAEHAYTDSNYGYQFDLPEGYLSAADPELLKKAESVAKEMGLNVIKGDVFSSDIFYGEPGKTPIYAEYDVVGVEMEAYALYTNAFAKGKKALTILSVSDNIATGKELSAAERQVGLRSMIELALNL